MIALFLALFALIGALPGHAQQAPRAPNTVPQRQPAAGVPDRCGSFVGKNVDVTSFSDIVKAVRNFDRKKEFETTNEYVYRVKKSDFQKSYAVSKPFSTEGVAEPLFGYNADAGEFCFNQYAFSNEAFISRSALLQDKIITYNTDSLARSVHAVIRQEDAVTGTYEARTGFNVPVTVVNILRKSEVIFEKMIPYDNSSFSGGIFPERPKSTPSSQTPSALGSPGIKFRLAMSRDKAKDTASGLRAGFLFETKEPFYSRVTHKPFTVSRTNPRDIEENVEILFGDFQCAFVLDSQNVVLLAITTH